MRARLLLTCAAMASATVVAAEVHTPLQACTAAASSPGAISQCLERKLRDAEAAMAAALAAARQESGRVDLETGKMQGTKALAAAQKEFLNYRKSNCAWHAARTGGAGASDAAQDCMIQMTSARADDLRSQTAPSMAAAQTSVLTESTSVMAWQGVDWKLSKMVREGREVPLVAGSKVTANFHAAGRVAGVASLNRYFGSYKASGDGRIEWAGPSFGATQMAGKPELMQQERLYLDALAKVSNARMEGQRLRLSNQDGTVELTFDR
jgi:heat shock protein HslJ